MFVQACVSLGFSNKKSPPSPMYFIDKICPVE